MLCHGVPGHLCAPGNDTVICLIGVNFHIHPDLPLFLGEFLRRWDPSQPIQDRLPLSVQLLDEHLQLLLTLFTGMGVDAFGMLGTVRPGGRVAALKEVVVDLGDAASSRFAGAPHNRLEIGEWILCCFRRVFLHLIAQAPVDFGGSFTQHMIADALELGPLRRTESELPSELTERLEQIRPEKMPSNVLPTLVAYYLANRPEDSDWVVLPVTNFDCYFGDTNFGRKYLNQLPREVIERNNSFGISRYRVKADYLPK